jgi:hypothetical protein
MKKTTAQEKLQAYLQIRSMFPHGKVAGSQDVESLDTRSTEYGSHCRNPVVILVTTTTDSGRLAEFRNHSALART